MNKIEQVVGCAGKRTLFSAKVMSLANVPRRMFFTKSLSKQNRKHMLKMLHPTHLRCSYVIVMRKCIDNETVYLVGKPLLTFSLKNHSDTNVLLTHKLLVQQLVSKIMYIIYQAWCRNIIGWRFCQVTLLYNYIYGRT